MGKNARRAIAAISFPAVVLVWLGGREPARGEPPSDARPPAVASDADKMAVERAADEAGYREHCGWRSRLREEFLGCWVAIAGGKAFPVNATGTAVRPAATMDEAVSAAKAAFPNARHRFVFRVGEEGDLDEFVGGSNIPHVVGNAFQARLQGLGAGD